MLHHGDLFDVLPTLDAASIDALVSDPPYGIGFMGREWDTFRPDRVKTAAQTKQRKDPQQLKDMKNVYGRKRSPALSPSQIEYDYTVEGLRGFQLWTERWAREVHRVLKPGAYLVVCGAPRSYHRMACGLEDAGFVIRDKFSWLFGSGFPKSYDLGDGKGTALKPAHEPIALAWKPFKGTIEKCHATHGTAALNIDPCRIESDETWEGGNEPPKPRERGIGFASSSSSHPLGRWPANVVIDDIAAAAIDEQSGTLVSGTREAGTLRRLATGNVYNGGQWERPSDRTYEGSIGGASRFYYCAKPSREERDMGCHHLDPRQRDETRKEGGAGGDNPRNRGLQPRGNFHPTVKPIDLMRWLVRLVTPVDGIVLDPFAGSGTTGCACAYEGRKFIGIEREADYIAIAERRIAACLPLFGVSA